jgi:hypothetical protein
MQVYISAKRIFLGEETIEESTERAPTEGSTRRGTTECRAYRQILEMKHATSEKNGKL